LTALASRDDPEMQAEVRANAVSAVADKNVVKALQEQVRARAAVLGIEPEILATRRDLAAVALGTPPPHLRTGWRSKELATLLGHNALVAAVSAEGS
jgi:ribonuclease D